MTHTPDGSTRSGHAFRKVGIDIGGTKILAVALDADYRVIAWARRLTPRGSGSLDLLVDIIGELAKELGAEDALGVGMPGLVTRGGVLRAAPNLDGVAEFHIGAVLEERLGLKVSVDNDATCAAVAEWQLGAGRKDDSLLLVTLGTGVGGGLIANGVIQRGLNGFAGEFGHMVVNVDGPRCPCGQRGCWERYASGVGLMTLAREAATGNRLKAVVEYAGGDAASVRAEHVMAVALDGDGQALKIVDDYGRWVALGLANLTNALDPAMIVIGGGLVGGGDLYLDPIVRWYHQLLYRSDLRPVPPIKFAEWGQLAGAVGAALLPSVRPAGE